MTNITPQIVNYFCKKLKQLLIERQDPKPTKKFDSEFIGVHELCNIGSTSEIENHFQNMLAKAKKQMNFVDVKPEPKKCNLRQQDIFRFCLVFQWFPSV